MTDGRDDGDDEVARDGPVDVGDEQSSDADHDQSGNWRSDSDRGGGGDDGPSGDEQAMPRDGLSVADDSGLPVEEYTTGRRSLSPVVRYQWGIRTAVGALVVGLLVTVGVVNVGLPVAVGGAVTLVLLALGAGWVVVYYRRWVYQVRADAIYLERGVVTHVRTLVPYVRIQHVDTSRGPLERALGLSTLVVYTAGSRGADVSIPGLTPEEASDLQQRVKELAIEAEGGDAL